MTFAATAGLGAIAGGTIFLGLPVGRARNLSVIAAYVDNGDGAAQAIQDFFTALVEDLS